MGSYYSIDTYLGPRINPFEWQPIAVFILFYRGLRPVARRIPTRFERIKVRNDAKEKKKSYRGHRFTESVAAARFFCAWDPILTLPTAKVVDGNGWLPQHPKMFRRESRKSRKCASRHIRIGYHFVFLFFFYRSVFLSRQRWNSVKRKSKKKKTIELIW